jgi:uncharacterized protein YacL
MLFTEKEMQEDLHKVRIRKYLYLGGGLLILALAVALFVIFIVKKDWAAFTLSLIGFFWCIMLAYHFKRTRDLEALIRRRVQEEGSEAEFSAAADEASADEPQAAEREPAGLGPDGGRS